jgi:branched-chain amino acid aminotransferase group I
MAEVIYINGEHVTRNRAAVSAFDHGFLYGFGLFETMRAYNGRIFKLEQHLERLKKSAEELGITLPGIDLTAACYDTIKANRLSDARLRLTLTAGPGEAVPDTSTCKGTTTVIIAHPLRWPPPEKYEKGCSAVLSSYRRNSGSPLSRIKTTSYAESVLARREARMKGVDEVVMLNEKGFLAEGSISNIFLVKGGALVTPSLESGILPGITRAAVLKLAESGGLKIEERQVSYEELKQAEEAFFTNSVLEVMPIAQFENRAVGKGTAGVITRKLTAAYRDLTGQDKNRQDLLVSRQ